MTAKYDTVMELRLTGTSQWRMEIQYGIYNQQIESLLLARVK